MSIQISIEAFSFQGQKRIRVNIPYHQSFIAQIKTIEGRRWDMARKFWHIPYTKEAYLKLQQLFPNIRNKQSVKAAEAIPKAPILKTVKREYGEVKVVLGDKIIVEVEDQNWLRVFVPYDKKSWIEYVRNIPNRKWDREAKCWLIPYTQQSIGMLQTSLSQFVVFNFDALNPSIPPKTQLPNLRPSPCPHTKNTPIRSAYIKMNEAQKEALTLLEEKLIIKRYRSNTIKSYKSHLTSFLIAHPALLPASVKKEDIQQYLLKLIREKNIAESTQNQIINALKFYMEKILGREREYIDIDRPRKAKTLPNVLSEAEVKRLFEATENIKHKCILMLIYSAGLRRSEVINLQIEDICKERKLLFVKDAKGKKDRYTLLSEKVLGFLRDYYVTYRPKAWLFEGQYGGKYSASSVQKIFHKAVKRANIRSRPTVHTLRHSFATHLVERGVNLKIVQDLLGHQSSKTTEIYLHIANNHLSKIISPIEDMEF